MAKGTHAIEIDMPIHKIWDFVSDINNWAPLVPGYTEHTIINDRKSVWKINGDLGVLQRTVHVNVHITEWNEPSNVSFELSSSGKTCVGSGYFKAESLSQTKTKMTGFLDVKIQGMMKPVVNPVLKTIVPKVGKDFTEKIANKIIEKETVRATS
ncbi:CoxG family protein [Oceanobacillus bengalensis]|uniref:SRPBCC family protein n=1 Tax=Oceanobacillus bengalensis TaxID=1435466 RepID=A0A494Z281_9BACI|nr:SRPBCC family protein [Oceanobacillus bengalensis]RKQ16597.1 SRPBCC family protein [Oceanobacillus bengalensis]